MYQYNTRHNSLQNQKNTLTHKHTSDSLLELTVPFDILLELVLSLGISESTTWKKSMEPVSTFWMLEELRNNEIIHANFPKKINEN